MKIATKYLKNLDDVLLLLSDQADIYPDETGWDIKTIGRDHVSLAHIRVSKDLFTDYEVTEKFSIDVYRLRDALKTAGDEVELVFETGRIKMTSDRLVQRMALLACADIETKVPELKEYTADVLCDSAPFQRLLNAAGAGKNDACKISMTPEAGITFATKNSYSDKIELSIPAEECVTIEGAGMSAYSITYLRDFIKVVPKGALIEMRFATNYPLTIEYGDVNFMVTWILAPWIMNDEDEE